MTSSIATGSIYFVSDVHWQPVPTTDTQVTQAIEVTEATTASADYGLFSDFLLQLSDRATQPGGISLYILGDLFEFWYERGNKTFAFFEPHIRMLEQANAAGIRMTLLFGNRDFTYGKLLKSRVNATIAGDHVSLDLGDHHVLCEHGDLLCSRDIRYRLYRYIIRSAPLRCLASLISLDRMTRIITWMRKASTAEVQRKSMATLDVVNTTVQKRMARGFDTVICGHTHHAERRFMTHGKQHGELIKLGSWEQDEGSYACWNGQTITLERFTR